MIWIRLILKLVQEKVKKMTVVQLVKSLERRVEIRDYIVHFIDGSQCNFLKLNAQEIKLEVTSFHWNNHDDKLHIYVEEVK